VWYSRKAEAERITARGLLETAARVVHKSFIIIVVLMNLQVQQYANSSPSKV